MGSVSCTNPDGLCCNPAPVCTHLLAALPVAASSFLKSRTHELSGRVQASGSHDAGGRDDRFWHECDIARSRMDVRLREKSGRAAEITGTTELNPKRT